MQDKRMLLSKWTEELTPSISPKNTGRCLIRMNGLRKSAMPAERLGIRYVILRHELGFIGILEARGMFPDSKNRWCTSYLKTDLTEKWIRANRHLLGERCLYLTGERKDESPRRAKLPESQIHKTTLKTTRKGIFTCHWHRPVLNYEKGRMFEWSKKLGLDPHPCYEYLTRCSCIACVLMPDLFAIENMKKYPHKFKKLIQAELRNNHTWKALKNFGIYTVKMYL